MSSSEQNASEAINLARKALALARESMMNGPPGIDPMASVRAQEWRDIRDRLSDLERSSRS